MYRCTYRGGGVAKGSHVLVRWETCERVQHATAITEYSFDRAANISLLRHGLQASTAYVIVYCVRRTYTESSDVEPFLFITRRVFPICFAL